MMVLLCMYISIIQQQKIISFINDTRYVADRMYDTIEPTSIIDCLLHPHELSASIMCSEIPCSISLFFIEKTDRGMKPISSSSSDQTSTNWRLDDAPKSCISSVNISGSDSSGMKLFLYSIISHIKQAVLLNCHQERGVGWWGGVGTACLIRTFHKHWSFLIMFWKSSAITEMIENSYSCCNPTLWSIPLTLTH